MGIKSTHYLTRDIAIIILSRHLYKADNDALADMLEALPESTFRNYQIVSEEDLEEINRKIYEENQPYTYTINFPEDF